MLLVTEHMVLRAKIRAGQHPTISLNRKPGSSIHTDTTPFCLTDETCPCTSVCAADPAEREFLSILNLVEDNDETFTDSLETGYMTWYDQRAAADHPELTATGLYQFMTTRPYPEYSERWNAGFVAGLLLGLGESNPKHIWRSAEPPERAVQP